MSELKDYLEREGISHKRAGVDLFVHENTIARICQGRGYPSYHLAKAIEEYTGGEIKKESLMNPDKEICPHCGNIVKKRKKSLGDKEGKI